MVDLVCFWYVVLFLFVSVYIFLEEGYVCVDVFYVGMVFKMKGYVNVVGFVVFGMLFCVVIIFIGMGGK